MTSRPQTPAPGDPVQLLNQAANLHRSGKLVDAERIYRRILQIDPGNPDALHLLGLIAHQAGNADAALHLINQAISANPGAAPYYANAALVLESAGRFEEAANAARQALALSPDHGQALACLANALHATDALDEALATYRKALEVVPGEAGVWSNYGTALDSAGSHDEAIAAYRRALALAPGHAGIHANLGSSLRAAGQAEEAIAAYREALRIDPALAPAWNNLANLLLETGRPAEAAEALNRCLEVRPGDRKALAFLAAAARETGDDATCDKLLDFDRLMAARRWDEAPGFDSMEAFNQALAEHVLAHPTLTWEPATKSTRGGSQTRELLDDDHGPIAALESMIREAVQDYLDAVPADSAHPFLATAPRRWKLTLWATILDRGGHQSAHCHPTGWLSGVYYVAVPPADDGGDEHAGWIEFGRAPDSFRLERPPKTRLLEPVEGGMFLFPSYLYHRTVPFAGERKRISIAFDVMPLDERAGDVARPAALSDAELASQLDQVEGMLRGMEVGKAEALARRLSEGAPESARARYLWARTLHSLGNLKAAREQLEEACRIDPDDARYHTDLGNCLHALGDFDAAVAALERAASIDRFATEPFMRLANLYSDRGQFPEARRAYEAAIARDPGSGGAHYGLVLLKDRMSPDDPQIRDMRAALDRGGLEATEEAALCFALGRALDNMDELDEAWRFYQRGNRIKRDMSDFSIDMERDNTRRIIASFPPDLFQGETTGDPSELPVFIVGMPRSGTTLLEQILDSHPEVHGAGELNDLWRILSGVGRWLPRGSSLPEAVAQVPPEGWADLGARFVRQLRRHHGTAARIVDKLPFNYTLVGIIRLMLPGARILHSLRDPRDTCLSCYLTSFNNDRGFTSDLIELGQTYRHYAELMDHWHRVLPGGLMDVRYEDLVEDVESGARRVIEFLDLPWDDRCLAFHENRRVVKTASMTQVRQPVYKSAMGRWKRYEAHLSPLLDALGEPLRHGWPDTAHGEGRG